MCPCICAYALPKLLYGDTSVNSQGSATGPVVYFCHNGVSLQLTVTVLPVGLLASRRVLQKAHTSTNIMPTTTGSIHMYLDDLLTNPGAHQEALEITSWLKLLCQRLGLVTNLDISVNLISGYHISGDRAGHSCWPRQDIRQEGYDHHVEYHM